MAPVLVGLLLDAEDTAVTRQTADALVRVGTVSAVRLIVLAAAVADDNQADWMQAGVHDALVGPGSASAFAMASRALARDPDEAVRRGAAKFSVWVDGIAG
ncbi:hypothetical protein [Streptomyces sp. NPDC047014]|uniref:hypothetical protein n=1 Tax=Streptomyces sp. NPDC047014 TaxID=3155736 RepID=UPI003404AB1C